MSTQEAFGRAVREHREAIGMVQEVFAKRARLHQTYVSGIERGRRNPTLQVIRRIADALEVRPSELMRTAEDLENTR